MSFFHEPPPLDLDVPPPLDDKSKPKFNDFDLELDEEIEDTSYGELPELPSDDFNLYDDTLNSHNLAPEIPSALLFDATPPDDEDFSVTKKSSSDVSQDNDISSEKNDDISKDDEEQVPISATVIAEVIENIYEKVLDTNQLEGCGSDEISQDSIEKPLENEVQVKSVRETETITEAENNKIESINVSESFELQNDCEEEEDDFCDFVTNNAPEQTTEFTQNESLENNFTNFNAFSEPVANEASFEADFSAFSFEAAPAQEINFKIEEPIATVNDESRLNFLEENFNDDDDNEDEFGDFNDFTQAAEIANINHSIQLTKSDVNVLLNEMFPVENETLEESNELKSRADDNIISNLNNFDATLALSFIYNSSTASQGLVKALGIDTRNILLGPQWNTSSSNMPRFAMSFNPLEPLKPSQIPSSNITSDASSAKMLAPVQTAKTQPDVVPEAEFDWKSAGLINPLDGKQLNSQSNDDQPQTIFAAVEPPAAPKEMILEPEVETKAKLELNENQAPSPYSWQGDFSGHNNIIVRERTIKLPETHIFTPIKGTNTIAREVVSRDESPSSIVVKEYHDVEYSLEPKKKVDQEFEFDDFQSAAPIESINVVSEPVVPLNILEPKKVESQKTEISWPDPGDVAPSSIADELDFLGSSSVVKNAGDDSKNEELSDGMKAIESLGKLDFKDDSLAMSRNQVQGSLLRDEISKELSVDVLSFVNNSLKVDPDALKASQPPLFESKETFFTSKGANLTNNTISQKINKANVPDDDDFSDFQSHSVAKNSISKHDQPLNPITLSPAKLVSGNTHKAATTSWLNSFDDDEVSRIEEAFPKCKKVQKKPNEDDDWSDFVSVNQPAPSISSNIANNKTVNGDDWSDFVSVPVKQPQQSAPRPQTFQSKPNFAAWNQPLSKPYNVHHATSFLTSEPRNSSAYQYTSNNYQFVSEKSSRPSMNITSNFSYPFNAPASNGISTILPDLDFAIPKNLINLPRSGSASDASKK